MPLYLSSYGRGEGPIILDELDCRGDESSLLDCFHIPIGFNNCGHYEDAGVYCYGNLNFVTLKEGYFLVLPILLYLGATQIISPSQSSGLIIDTVHYELCIHVFVCIWMSYILIFYMPTSIKIIMVLQWNLLTNTL